MFSNLFIPRVGVYEPRQRFPGLCVCIYILMKTKYLKIVMLLKWHQTPYCGDLYSHEITLISICIRDNINYKVWGEIMYQLQNGCIVEFWNGHIVSTHNFLAIWLLIHARIKVNGRGHLRPQQFSPLNQNLSFRPSYITKWQGTFWQTLYFLKNNNWILPSLHRNIIDRVWIGLDDKYAPTTRNLVLSFIAISSVPVSEIRNLPYHIYGSHKYRHSFTMVMD